MGDDGLVIDFTRIKTVLRQLIDELDHRMLIAEDDPRIELQVRGGSLDFSYGDKRYVIPSEDALLLPLTDISGERLSGYLLDRFIEMLGDVPNVVEVELGLDEGPGQGAWAHRRLAEPSNDPGDGGGHR